MKIRSAVKSFLRRNSCCSNGSNVPPFPAPSLADARRRELMDHLISEQTKANEEHRERLQEQVPAMTSRYLKTMDEAMEILRGA